jgi:lysophospholipase L1-like esterase
MTDAEDRIRFTDSAPRLLLKFAGSCLLTAALLFLAEAGAGFFVGPQQPIKRSDDAVSRTLAYLDINPAPLRADADLLWRNESGARKTQPVNPQAFGREDVWTLEINSDGFRGLGHSRRKPDENTFRILCVGDSITFGFSVDQALTYPQQLERLLRKRHPNRHFEVINAGVPGWSYLQGLRFLEVQGMALDPDLIVIGHGTNDQLYPAMITDKERLGQPKTAPQRVLQSVAAFAATTNIYRAISGTHPKPLTEEPSPGCSAQIAELGACRRVSIDQITSAIQEVSILAARNSTDLLVANTDFVRTAAIVGVRRGVRENKVVFADLVWQLDRRSRAADEARARRLGLAQSELSHRDLRATAGTSKEIILRVAVPDADRDYRVTGSGYFFPGVSIEAPLFDDGTHGDERAADGVFSTTITLAAEVPAIAYKYHQDDTAEFQPLPPLRSTLGDRALSTPRRGLAPVDEFGYSLFMVERAHPNENGHRLIAQILADEIEKMPAFLAYLRGSKIKPNS